MMLFPIATDDIGFLAMLPFVAPALLILVGLLVMLLRDRLRREK